MSNYQDLETVTSPLPQPSCFCGTTKLFRFFKRDKSIHPVDRENYEKKLLEKCMYESVCDDQTTCDVNYMTTELKEQFQIVDLNNDGYIDATELKKILLNLKMPHSDEEVHAMIEQADLNGSGKIEEDDFMKMMTDYLTTEKEKELNVRMLFDVFDSDKDGYISQFELKSALSEFLQETVSKKEIDAMMKHACKGSQKTTMISFRDFQDLLDDVGFSG